MGRLLGHMRGGGNVYADEAYERAKAEKEAAPAGPDLDAVFAEIIELARSRGCYVASLKLEVARRGRRRTG